MKSVKSGIIWITGLSGAGKTTFAHAIYRYLKQKYNNVILCDGDIYRQIAHDFNYERAQRIQSSFQFVEWLSFLEQNDLIIVVATISTFNEIYALNRQKFKNYFEIYIHCSFEELVRRDKNGLYSGALQGRIKNVVGVDIAYDEPCAHFVLENSQMDGLEGKTKMLLDQVEAFLR